MIRDLVMMVNFLIGMGVGSYAMASFMDRKILRGILVLVGFAGWSMFAAYGAWLHDQSRTQERHSAYESRLEDHYQRLQIIRDSRKALRSEKDKKEIFFESLYRGQLPQQQGREISE